jgi:signal transduction histidine kinase
MNVARAHRGASSIAGSYEEHEHEVRAALFGIEASVQGLARHRDRLTRLQVDELAEGLVAEVRRLRGLLEGRVEDPSTFDLADAIAPVITSASASGLDVRSSVRRGIKINGRRDSTAQVVLALLDNARQHAAPSPVEVRASVLGGSVVLYVEDRGTTITGRSRERMFEKGVRGDESSGSGLGLFVARRLMAQQGGTLAFRVRPGGGASFVVRFQRATTGNVRRPGLGLRVCAIPQ